MEQDNSVSIKKSADAEGDNWVYKRLPESWWPRARLARLDRPVGVWLLLLPGWWGLAIADITDLIYYGYVALGALLMRSAGCAYNDMLDYDIDAKVSRTATRPIPAGELSRGQALRLVIILSLVAFVILLQFPPLAILMGIASLLPVALYPLMKRITWWPQAWLGLTFNWGILLGAAVSGTIPAAAWLLYGGALFWTLGYDTIYAHQDREEDALIGVKSTARRLGKASRPAIALFYALFLFALAGAGLLAKTGAIYYIGVAGTAGHLIWQLWRLDIDDPNDCLRLFKSNVSLGLWLAVIMIAEAHARFVVTIE